MQMPCNSSSPHHVKAACKRWRLNPPDFKRARAEAARKCSSAAGRALVVQCAHPARATSRIVMEALASELDHEGKPEKAACFRLLNNILKQRTKFRTMHDITAMSFDHNNTCVTAVLQWHRCLQASSCASRTHRRSCGLLPERVAYQHFSTSGPKGPRRRLRRRVPDNTGRRAGGAC